MSLVKKNKCIESPKGVHDVTPDDQKLWRYILKKADAILEYYGFERIETGLFESADLFERTKNESLGLDWEPFVLKTKSGESLALRSDYRISTARSYVENGMSVRPHPVKLSYVGPVFRNQELKPGFYRQFFQLGAETIGDGSEIIDAELIFMGYKILESLGLGDYNVNVNSVGDNLCRPSYIRSLKDYYKNKIKRLCACCRENVKTNPFAVLECREESCLEVNKEVPQFVDFLCEGCRLHFKHVIESLDEVKVPYILQPFLVRMPDYYTRTVFEFIPEQNPDQTPVLRGARYDRLIELFGGARTPAAGWVMGLDQVAAILREKNISISETRTKPKIFLVQLGEMAKKKSLSLFENFRKAGIEAKSSLGRDSIKSQLRIANRLGARFTLIFGQKEALDGTVILREMDTGVQETIPIERISDELKKRLKNT